MSYIAQMTVILLFCFIGEALHMLLPFPVPGSIYGLVLLFLSLVGKAVSLSRVRDAARYLVEIMALFFVPAGVGLLEQWDLLLPILLPVSVILLLTTVLVMGVSGRMTQALMRRKETRRERG